MRTLPSPFLIYLAISVLTSARAENAGEYSLPLPNSYHIERYNSREVMIVDPESTIVVAGLVPGYFVVDMSAGEVLLGLSEQGWTESLMRRNISVPQLLGPP